MQMILNFDYKGFGERVRRERKARNLTLQRLEKQIGITYSTLSRVENYKDRTERGPIAMIYLAHFFKINLSEYIIDDYNEAEPMLFTPVVRRSR